MLFCADVVNNTVKKQGTCANEIPTGDEISTQYINSIAGVPKMYTHFNKCYVCMTFQRRVRVAMCVIMGS